MPNSPPPPLRLEHPITFIRENKANATRTDRNGSKTWKLWTKQCYRDLFVINYRFQGLAKKICKTHAKVLAIRFKVGVRSAKLGSLDGGFDFAKGKCNKKGYFAISFEQEWTAG